MPSFTPHLRASRRPLLCAIAVALALLIAALSGGRARATFPGPNGLIMYESTVKRHIQLFTIRPDGSGMRQLTHFGSDALHASWSPAGTRIAFERAFATHAGVFTMGANGRGLVSLTPKGLQGMPAYSPDGTMIVFDGGTRTHDGISVMRTDGSRRRQLTRLAAPGKNECRCEASPVFSPDGTRLAFRRSITDLKTAAFVINADGSGLKQLTPWRLGVAQKLDWSPDGSKIVFSSPELQRPGVASNVFTINPDGTGLTPLTHESNASVHDLAYTYSPDGKQVVFAKIIGDGPARLYAMNADGTAARPLTPRGVDARWASWGRQP